MVRNWFFPSHAKQDVFSVTVSDSSARGMRQRAVDKVNLWLFKAGQLPPAILATASLTEALLHDGRRMLSTGTTISDSAMQSIYAMAFARFVNGFVDRDVARLSAAEMPKDGTDGNEDSPALATVAAKGESSMYAHAVIIGMPQKFVDLRHKVTHADIPNLMYLKKMTEQALEWLRERWWAKNATGNPERALREVEERQRISRAAREARENSSGLTAQKNYDAPDMVMEDTAGPSTADSVITRRAITSRKRKSALLENDT